MKNPDVNDTLRADGTDAVRERHDRAYSNGRNREMPQPPPEILPPPYSTDAGRPRVRDAFAVG